MKQPKFDPTGLFDVLPRVETETPIPYFEDESRKHAVGEFGVSLMLNGSYIHLFSEIDFLKAHLFRINSGYVTIVDFIKPEDS